MSKAVEKAYKAYPLTEDNRLNHERNAKRVGFQQGYEQAEKDLELTWEDIKTIDKLLNQCVDYGNPYQEVLKRFKDLKK
jgi:hypothetical protein